MRTKDIGLSPLYSFEFIAVDVLHNKMRKIFATNYRTFEQIFTPDVSSYINLEYAI